MVIRRRTTYGEPAYADAMHHLAQQHAASTGVHELTRQRCAFELLRGYLDLAEFGPQEQKRDNLAHASHWLQKANPAQDPKSQQRYLLHRVRYLFIKDDDAAAQDELQKAVHAGRAAQIQPRGILVLKAVLAVRGNRLDEAEQALNAALAHILPLADTDSSEPRPLDPVLEAECYVLLARVAAAKNSFTIARNYLTRWELLSQFVDNYYLHHIAERIVLPDLPFELEYDFPVHQKKGDGIPKLKDRLQQFELWMLQSVHHRHPHFKWAEIATAYGRDRTAVSRRFGSKLKDMSS
jgi:hypothetical protein